MLAPSVCGQVALETYEAEIRRGVHELYHGSAGEAVAALRAAEAAYPGDPYTASYRAMVHARAGDAEKTLLWLERCAAAGYDQPGWIEGVTFFEELEDEPRYAAALEVMRANVGAAAESRRVARRARRESRVEARADGGAFPVQWNDGHTNQVAEILLSPDGERAVTAGGDLNVRLWDAWVGETLAVSGPYGDARISLVDDGERYVVFDQSAGTLDLHDGRSGEFIASLHDAEAHVTLSRPDPVTGRVVALDDRGVVRQYDPRTAAVAAPPLQLGDGHFETVGMADGRLFWSTDQGLGTRVHDAATGELLWKLPANGIPEAELHVPDRGKAAWVLHLDGHLRRWEVGRDGPVAEIAAFPWPWVSLEPSGNRLATIAFGSGEVRLFDGRTGEEVELAGGPVRAAFHLTWSPDGTQLVASGGACDTPRLWDARTGEVVSELRPNVDQAWFTPDGNELLTEWNTATGVVDRWDTRTGASLGPLVNTGFSINDASFAGERVALATTQAYVLGPSGSVPLVNHASETLVLALDAKGRIGVAGSGLRVWDLGGEGRPPSLAIHDGEDYTTSVDALPDGAGWLLAAPQDRLYLEGESGPIRRFPLNSKSVRSSPTGELYASTGLVTAGAGAATVEIATGEVVGQAPATFPNAGLLRETCTPAFDPLGELVVTPDGDGSLRVWRAWSGEEVTPKQGHTGPLRHLVFDPTGRYLASSSADQTARLWNAADFSPHASLEHQAQVWQAAFSPDGALVATAANDRVGVFDTATGERLQTLRRHAAVVSHVEFDPSGQRLLSASADGTVRIADPRSGAEQAVLRARGAPVRYASFTPDGTRVVTVGRDAAAHVFDAAGGELRVSLVTYDDGGWLAVTPSGHYVGSDNAADWAQLVLPGGRFPLSSYRTVLNDPAAVAAAVAGDVPARPFLPEAPELDLIWPESGVRNQREFELDARIEDRYGIADVEVHVAGIQVAPGKVAAGLRKDSGGRRARLNLKLSIPPEVTTARVTVRATNARGILSQVAAAELAYEAPRRRLFLLALGVGDYEEPRLKLQCPANDVRDLAAAFAAQEGAFYDEVLVEALVDDEVTVSAVERLRSRWLLRAGPDDTIVVFVAGHGVQDDAGEYWYLTRAATPEEPYSGINRANLWRLVQWEKLKSRRKLLLIDTCHSGVALEGGEGLRGVSPLWSLDDVESLVDEEGGGLYVLAASAEAELAREQDGNGLFTRAVIDALAGAADRAPHGDEDGFVDVEEVLRYAQREVEDRSNGRQTPTIPEVRGGENFRLGRVP